MDQPPPVAIDRFHALQSPAAERNKDPILSALSTRLPQQGQLLELACGALQHALHMAPRFPQLRWQPTDVDERVLAAAPGYARALGEQWPQNLLLPHYLDVCESTWAVPKVDAIYLANLLHISPTFATEALFSHAPALLNREGAIFVYGPFKVGGEFRSAGDAQFDRSLRNRNPEWGIRDLELLADLAATAGLHCSEILDMPANNLLLRFDALS